MEEVVAVPVIARRLVALGARWLLMIGRVEEGLLELGRLGAPKELTDTRALLLSARFGDHEPKERIPLLEAAARLALDDDERQMALLALADELKKQGRHPDAMGVVAEILKTATDHVIIRGATALRWEASGEDKDFDELLKLMRAEESDDDLLTAAAYLIAMGRPDAVANVLERLLEIDHLEAQLIAIEADIRSGNCSAALQRFSSIDIDTASAPKVRLGHAHLQTMLVLDCGRDDLKEAALKALQEFSSSNTSDSVQELITALKRQAQT